MTFIPDIDWYTRVSRGLVSGHSIVHKFGRSDSVGTGFAPVAMGNILQTPQVGSATTLRIKSGGNANDTAAGSGAREITLIGLDASGNEQTVTVATNGASASTATTETWIRLNRAYVSKSGTYATATAGSHSGDIVIENGSGGTDWATISIDGGTFPRGSTEIGAYSIPTGYNGYLLNALGFTDSSKTTTLLFFQRTSILQTSAPYDAMRVVFEERAEGGEFTFDPKSPIKFTGPCDVGIMAKVNTGTAEVDVDFELLIVNE